MSEAKPLKRRRGRELLVGVVATATVLLALEVGARVSVWARALVIADEFEVVHPDGSWSPRPGFRKAGIEVNAFGFRGPEISLVKPAPAFRLVALGDSCTFGDRLSNQEIAARVHLSSHTVKDHLDNIRGLLDVRSGTEVVAKL